MSLCSTARKRYDQRFVINSLLQIKQNSTPAKERHTTQSSLNIHSRKCDAFKTELSPCLASFCIVTNILFSPAIIRRNSMFLQLSKGVGGETPLLSFIYGVTCSSHVIGRDVAAFYKVSLLLHPTLVELSK